METKSDYETTAITAPQELTPAIWQMLSDIGNAFCKSNKMSIHTPEEGAIKALFCFENQLPVTAARGLYFVNGRLGVMGEVIAALLRRHPDYDYEIAKLNGKGCTISVLRNGKVIGGAKFDESDAQRAGLLTRPNWKKYPADLYFAKAIERAQRRFAPDVFMAPVYAAEDMRTWDVIDAEPSALPPLPKQQAPTHQELQDRFGIEACVEAKLFNATTEEQLWQVEDKLAVMAAEKKDAP